MKNINMYLVLGQIAMAVSILLNHFVRESSPISFMIGFLTGLSIVFNLAYVVLLRKGKAQ